MKVRNSEIVCCHRGNIISCLNPQLFVFLDSLNAQRTQSALIVEFVQPRGRIGGIESARSMAAAGPLRDKG